MANRTKILPQSIPKTFSPLVELAYKDHLDLFLPDLWEILISWGPMAEQKVIDKLEEEGIL